MPVPTPHIAAKAGQIAKTVLRRPLRQMWGLCYFDLWGRIGLSYDHERDVLTLAGYGDYYRAEE